MAVRQKAKRAAPVLAGLSLLLGACAEGPAQRPIDPVYGVLAPQAEQLARATVQEALETQRSRASLSWTDEDDGSRGEVTPLRTFRTTAGYYCREYVEVVETAADGRTQRQRTACRDSDGQWKLIRV